MGRSTVVATAAALVLLAGCGASTVEATSAPAPVDDSSLQLRPVLEVDPLDEPCPTPTTLPSPAEQATLCIDDDGAVLRYRLAPARVTGGVASAHAAETAGRAYVQVTLDADHAAAFAELTGELADKDSPLNQVAIVVDGELLSAPTVAIRIEGGQIEIGGVPDLSRAQTIADTLAP